MTEAFSKHKGIGFDTSLVLLFLAVEVGRSGGGSIETLLMAVTILALLVLPYFLPLADGPSLGKWLAIRGVVVVLGLACGLVLPESMRFLPMNLLILAGISSCCIQFYGLMRLRPAN